MSSKTPQKPDPEEEEEGEEAVEDSGTGITAIAPVGSEGSAAAGAKKKKKNKKKKKAVADGATVAAVQAPQQVKVAPKKQTDPPSVPVSQLFAEGYPMCRRLEYEQDFNTFRVTSEEKRANERLMEGAYEDWRQAAEIHREVRRWARGFIKPGMAMMEIADSVEGAIRKLSGADQVSGGIAFPCGLSVNHIAAHWTPNAGDKTVLQRTDVLKVDIGVHVNGRIVDSAFTMCFEPQFEPLLQAVREATDAGVRACGVDVRLCDVGTAIQEVMESHEVELGGRTYGVRPIRNLYGHSVGTYRIHAGKSVPIVRGGEGTRMEEGDCFAIETFGSTGRGFVQDGPDCSHYMRHFEDIAVQSRLAHTKELFAHITRAHGTLAFARRWLAAFPRYQLALKGLIDCGAVIPYPPLVDERGSYVAQFEHTVCLKPTSKEVFSAGDDY